MRESDSRTRMNCRMSTLFDTSWFTSVEARKSDVSWANDVMETMNNGGRRYLDTLRIWFGNFPISNKQKNHLKTQLESYVNEDHLGAVNELAWWEFMQKIGIKANPIPASDSPHPDFKIESPLNFFVEVSTLNRAENEKKKFSAGQGVMLNHEETLRRLLLKIRGEEKQQQMLYAVKQRHPFVLVLFDYTTWSGLGTQLSRFLKEKLISGELPAELSTLIYIDRMVEKGRIRINRDLSAAYENPNAMYPISIGVFAELGLIEKTKAIIRGPDFSHQWIWLS